MERPRLADVIRMAVREHDVLDVGRHVSVVSWFRTQFLRAAFAWRPRIDENRLVVGYQIRRRVAGSPVNGKLPVGVSPHRSPKQQFDQRRSYVQYGNPSR